MACVEGASLSRVDCDGSGCKNYVAVYTKELEPAKRLTETIALAERCGWGVKETRSLCPTCQ